jgi:hypothetical protein
LEDGFEAGFFAGWAEESVGFGVEEADAGDGASVVAVAEHSSDGFESTGEVVECEVVAASGSEDGEDEDGVEVELEDVGLFVAGGVDADGFLEDSGVAGDGACGPLAGGDEVADLGDDAAGVVLFVDAADDGAVSAVEEIAEEFLAPHDADAFLGVFGALGFAGVSGDEGETLVELIGKHECVGVVFVESDVLLVGHVRLRGLEVCCMGSVPAGGVEGKWGV